jgi:hypothetical protein
MEIRRNRISFKKYISLLLVILMLFSCCGQSLAFAAEEKVKSYNLQTRISYDEDEYYMEVYEDCRYEVEPDTYFEFTAPCDGYYMISSYGYGDPILYFGDDYADDYSGYNFRYVFWGYEDETYYGKVDQYDDYDMICFDIVYYGYVNPDEYATSGDFYLTSGDFYATVVDNGCVITDYEGYESTITFPEEIGGFPVVGLHQDLYWQLYSAQVINFPASLTDVDVERLAGLYDLREVNFDSANTSYSSVNGIVYTADGYSMVMCPKAYADTVVIPAKVFDIRSGALGQLKGEDIVVENGNTEFVCYDGVLYSADMTRVIKEYAAKGDYVMPASVTEIDPYAFYQADEIASAVISPNVTSVSYYAFANCQALEDVVVADGVESIEKWAFVACEKLENLSLSDELAYIGDEVFAGDAIKKLDLPDSLVSMGSWTFSGCMKLAEVDLGSGLSSIPDGAFAACEALESIYFPANIIEIGGSAFAGTGLKSVVIPDTLEYIGDYAFEYCLDMESAYIGSGTTSMSGAFVNCRNLKEARIGRKVADMTSAFYGCENLEKVEFEDGFKGDISYAFSGCIKLPTVDLPDTVTTISYASFANCTSLGAIELPANLKSVSAHSFDNTKWFNSQPDGDVYLGKVLYCYKDTTEYPEYDDYEDYGVYGYYYDDFYSSSTYHDEVPGKYTLDVAYGTEIIADAAYAGQKGLEHLVLSDTVKYIGQRSFYYSHLRDVYITSSVKEIAEDAFYGCDYIRDVYYSGTAAEWDKMVIKSGNDALLNGRIHFNYFDCKHKNIVSVDGLEPGCGSYGYSAGTYCLDCEKWIEGHKYLSATANHTYTTDVRAATCDSDGYTVYNCTDCSYGYVGNRVAALGHGDTDKNGKCDRCNLDMTNGCTCRCHSTGFQSFIYKIMRFFWKFFKTNQNCACGAVHY